MLPYFVLAIVLWGLSSRAEVPPPAPAPMVMIVGETTTLSPAKSIWVEDGKVVRAADTPRGVQLHAHANGTSEVRLDQKTYQINVLTLQQDRTRKILQKVLPHTLGLHLAIHDGSVNIEGQMRRFKDWQQIAQACLNQHCVYNMQASIDESLWGDIESKLNQHMQQAGLPPQNFEHASPPTVHIPPKSAIASDLQRVLMPFGISLQKDSSSIEIAPLVKVQITVAEVKKDYLLQYGLKWPASIQAQVWPSLGGAPEAEFVTAEFWEKTGAGKVLASPNLLCRSGKDAEFLAGGEFPIKIINFHMQDVVWKKYGVLLKVSPVADFSGRMSLAIETEVSSIDNSRTVDGVPGLYTNRVQSFFDLAKPKTIAISGLIKSEEGTSKEGLPGLRSLPILGPLFGSKDFSENRTELVIFVRPEVVSPDAPSEPIRIPTVQEAGL